MADENIDFSRANDYNKYHDRRRNGKNDGGDE